MKYAGMPMGMWMMFATSFRKQLTEVFGYGTNTAKAITKKAKPEAWPTLCDSTLSPLVTHIATADIKRRTKLEKACSRYNNK